MSSRLMNPVHLHVLELHLQGLTNNEIATVVQRSAQLVSNVINSPTGQEILSRALEKRLDTLMDVQTMAQMVAPICFKEKVELALYSKNEKVRSTNCKDILEMAGHVPQRSAQIERQPDALPNANKTPEELRRELLDAAAGPPTGTVH